MTRFGITALLLFGLGACEKDSGLSSKTSGKLRGHESSLLANLPSGNVALFGGNYMRLQGFFQNGPFAKMMGAVEQMSPGMSAWTNCFLEGDAAKLQIMGAVAYQDDQAVMTFVLKGWPLAQVEACAKKANFETTLDPDGKFIAIEMPNPLGKYTSGYLVLPDGSLFSRQAMPFPQTFEAPASATRADLEAAAASAARSNATADAVLVEEAARVDRDRAIWFVANLNGTPAGDKVGLVRGWMDLDGGLDFDVSVQIKDKNVADEISRALPEAKKQAKMLGEDFAAVIRALRYERKGDRFRFGLKITNAQLEGMMSSMGGMFGGGF